VILNGYDSPSTLFTLEIDENKASLDGEITDDNNLHMLASWSIRLLNFDFCQWRPIPRFTAPLKIPRRWQAVKFTLPSLSQST